MRPRKTSSAAAALWPRHWPATNCLLFALALFLRRHRRLGPTRRHYIAFRRSDAGRFPHFLYVEHLPHSGQRLISYKPTHPIARACPPLIFRGAVRWGDQQSILKEPHAHPID